MKKLLCVVWLLSCSVKLVAAQVVLEVQPDFQQMVEQRQLLKRQINRKETIVDTIAGGALGGAFGGALYGSALCFNALLNQMVANNAPVPSVGLFEIVSCITAPSIIMSLALVQKFQKPLKHHIVHNLPSILQVRKEKKRLEKQILTKVVAMSAQEWQEVDLKKLDVRFAGRVFAAYNTRFVRQETGSDSVPVQNDLAQGR